MANPQGPSENLYFIARVFGPILFVGWLVLKGVDKIDKL